MTACPKQPRIRCKAYRDRAKHMPCRVLSCTVHGTTGEVVFAHINLPENSGMRLKAPDTDGIYLCREHHDDMDGRGTANPIDRCLWIVRNIVLPECRQDFERWEMGVGR